MDLGALRAHLPAFTAGLLAATSRPQSVPVVASTACECHCDCSGISRAAAAALVLFGALLLLGLQLAWAGSAALRTRFPLGGTPRLRPARALSPPEIGEHLAAPAASSSTGGGVRRRALRAPPAGASGGGDIPPALFAD